MFVLDGGWGRCLGRVGQQIVLYFQFKEKCGHTTKYFTAVDLKE